MPRKQHGIGVFSSCVRSLKEPQHISVLNRSYRSRYPFQKLDWHPEGAALDASIFLPRRATRFGKEVTICPRVGRGAINKLERRFVLKDSRFPDTITPGF